MAHILHLDASPRGNRSHSRRLTQDFMTRWKAVHANDTVSYRDLGHNPVPTVDEPWIAAAFSKPETHTPELKAAIAFSDELIDEFMAADRYVMGIPMYNFSIPAGFKAYIDQILRAGRTFVVSETGYQGLATGKKMLIITSRGGSYPAGTPMAQFDLQEPYLRTAFGFIGVTDITFIHADNLNSGEDARQQSFDQAKAVIQQTVASW